MIIIQNRVSNIDYNNKCSIVILMVIWHLYSEWLRLRHSLLHRVTNTFILGFPLVRMSVNKATNGDKELHIKEVK
jgi:hypothetical protein